MKHIHRTTWIAGLALTLAACTNGERASRPTEPVVPAPASDGRDVHTQVAFCGAEFDIVVTSNDPELTTYGMPSTMTDNSHVCESWTGSDYKYTVQQLSTTDDDPATPEQVAMVKYSSGQITPAYASGTPFQGSTTMDPTLLDFMNADATLRAASFANPYYGVYAGCQCTTVTAAALGGLPLAFDTEGQAGARAFRHGIRRRGTRELVEPATEVASATPGIRRFTLARGSTTVTYTVDATRDLIVGEETVAPGEWSVATHHWRPTALGYVKDRSTIVTTTRDNGRSIRSTATVRLGNIRVGGNVL